LANSKCQQILGIYGNWILRKRGAGWVHAPSVWAYISLLSSVKFRLQTAEIVAATAIRADGSVNSE